MESFHRDRTFESGLSEVAALKLFHPTVSSVLSETDFAIATQSLDTGKNEGNAADGRFSAAC